MLEVTHNAEKEILKHFDGKEITPVRVFLNQAGCGGPALALGMDNPNEQDNTYKVGDLTFLVEKDFMEKIKPVKIDFSNAGFNISAGMDFGPSGCAGCASAEGTCGS
ncbi:MAG: IscA/HesB family protein [Deltaproteobacteria bacterium]|nr:IscA/HesB family protein [Deltaproteobacteria bacterium]